MASKVDGVNILIGTIIGGLFSSFLMVESSESLTAWSGSVWSLIIVISGIIGANLGSWLKDNEIMGRLLGGLVGSVAGVVPGVELLKGLKLL